MSDKNVIFLMISNQIAKYLNNDLYSPMIYMAISNLNFTDDYNIISIICLLILFLGLIYGLYKLYEYINEQIYVTLKLIDNFDIKDFQRYLTMEKYITNHNNVIKGDILDVLNNKMNDIIVKDRFDINYSDDGVKVYFNDTKNKAKGYYYFTTAMLEKTIIKNDKESSEKVNHKYLTIKFYSLGKFLNSQEYLDYIKNFLEEYEKTNLDLYYCKIICVYDSSAKELTDSNHYTSIYKGPLITDPKYYNNIFSDFFHNDKDIIMSRVYNIKENPLSKLSLILHGPPGTGKTSFAYRVAKYYNRHIISLDPSKMKKNILFQVFDLPYIQGKRTYKDCVFVFDEFDNAFFELYEREMNSKKILDHNLQRLSSNDDKPIILETNNFDVKISDLIELFQGVIPRHGSIAIVTTNHFDKINSICPALFRPGRLTPVYFGYLNKKSFCSLYKHFYEEDFIGELPEEIKIPPSELIELAQTYDKKTFVKEIMKRL